MVRQRNLKITALVLFYVAVSAAFFANVPLVHGLIWSPDMRITWDAEEDVAPSAAQALDGKIWYAWQSYRTGDYEIFYKVYDPTKANPWSGDVQLTNSPGLDIVPAILHSTDDRTWIAWTTRRNGNYDIYYKIFNGTSWTNDMSLVSASGDDDSPSLLQTANGTIWLFWSSKRTGNKEIFLKTSSDNGTTWSNEVDVTLTTSQDEKDPYVTQAADGKIWLVFTKCAPSTAPGEIFYKTYDGVSWSSDTAVTNDPSEDTHPSIVQAANGDMWVVWDSDRILGSGGALQNDIFYRVRSGGSWGAETRFTNNPEDEDNMPSIMRTSDGNLTVSWSATRGGMHDIYYRSTSPLSSDDVGIFYVATSKSVVALNRVVSIDYVAQNHGTNPETFAVNLYANSTLLKSTQVTSLAPGDLSPMSYDWNTSGAALGNYTIKVNATVVTGETHTVDNEYIDGKVWVVVHDVAVTGVSVPVRLAYPGYTYFRVIYVNVTNKGTISENDVSVTTMYNSSIIGIQTVTLGVGENATLMFLFNTYSISYSNYTITAEATPNQDEDNQDDNLLGGGTVLVTIPGDITGNRVVDIMDWSRLSAHWSGPPTGPLGYALTADINEDGEVNILDMAIMSAYWDRFW